METVSHLPQVAIQGMTHVTTSSSSIANPLDAGESSIGQGAETGNGIGATTLDDELRSEKEKKKNRQALNARTETPSSGLHRKSK